MIQGSESAIPAAELLYVTADSGTSVKPETVERIGARVAQGAWLFVDPCGSDTGMLESFAAWRRTVPPRVR